jgi:multidrug efflux pump subunit AcrA (membrane-fusion protein)
MNMNTTADIPRHNAPPSDDDSQAVDTQLVLETRNQIRALVDEVRRLSEGDLPLAEFYDGLMTRIISALAASGGAVWTIDDDHRLQLVYSASWPALDEAGQLRHSLLLRRIVRDRQPLAAPPKSGFPDDQEAGNPTAELLLLAPVIIDQRVVGLLEVVQRPGGGPTTQRGYLRFLAQMCELASGFVRNHRLRLYAEREVLWRKLEQFLHELHRSLDVQTTSLALVNEARLVVECDRVSLALPRGAGYRLAAVSGLDNVDRRTEQLDLLSRLVETVLGPGEAFWRGDESIPLAPQIEGPLHAYVDKSHTKAIGIVPLCVQRHTEGATVTEAAGDIVGALIFEQMTDDRWTDTLRRRADAVVHYAAPAIAHTLEHDRIFLRPLWTWLGDWRRRFDAHWQAKACAAASVAAIAVLVLALFPARFDVAVRGKLEPSRQWEIFAPQVATVVDVPVKHGQQVAADDLLVQLSSTEIEVQLAELQGRQRVIQEQLDAARRALLDSGHGGRPRLSAGDEARLGGEVLQLTETRNGLAKEIELVRQKLQSLAIRAEHSGEVVTWQVEQALLRRPVQPGQALMTVVDPQGPWEVLLQLPERRLVHVDHALKQYPADQLQVTFMLSTSPGREFTGRVLEIERSAEVRGEDGNTVLVKVAIDAAHLPPLRRDITVTAKLHCGRRSLGYVWFCDLLETVQTKVLFWL